MTIRRQPGHPNEAVHRLAICYALRVVRYPRFWLTTLHAAFGFGCAYGALHSAGPARWLLAWTCVACFAVALAYVLDRPAIFGKQSDGSVSYLVALPVLPVLLVQRSIWAIRCALTSEPASNEVAPGLFVGRRVDADRLPPAVDLVFDLTSEFAEPKGVRERGLYRSIPTLDGLGPPRHEDHLAVLQ